MNATRFVKDFGMMASLVAAEKLSGVAQEIFMQRLGVIHDGTMIVARREAARG